MALGSLVPSCNIGGGLSFRTGLVSKLAISALTSSVCKAFMHDRQLAYQVLEEA